MTNELAIRILTGDVLGTPEQTHDAIKMAVEALSQLDVDTISRKSAIDIAMQYCPDDDGSCSKAGADIREMLDELEDLPPAQPEHGRWIDEYGDGDWHCSRCGAIVEKHEQDWRNWYFCYHCGASMSMDEVEE